MKTITRNTKMLISLLALSVVAASYANEDMNTKMEEDQKEVLETVESMTAAFESGDIEAVMGFYEGDATVLFEAGNPVSDEASIRQMFTGASQVSPKFEYSGHEVVVQGDLATHIAPWKMRATLPDGSEIEQEGLSVAVLRRQPDGRWLLVIDNPHGGRLLDR